MSPAERVDLGVRMADIALQQQHRERLQRRHPMADAAGISWVVIREILELDPGTGLVRR